MKVGDCIVEVNGVRGDYKAMLTKVQAKHYLERHDVTPGDDHGGGQPEDDPQVKQADFWTFRG